MKTRLLFFAIGFCLVGLGTVLAADKSVIVTFKRQPGRTEESLVRKAKGKIHRSHQLINAMTVSLPEEKIDELRKNSQIAYVETNAVYRVELGATECATATDSELAKSWGVKHIFADVAHAAGNKGTGVKVAVLDTGIDYTHPDLKANYIGGRNFVFDNDDPLDDSFNSHGTHVAGIIAARANGSGVVGVAPEAKILAVKVLDGAGFGSADWIIAGIEWAVAHQAKIINMSLQGPNTQALQDACNRARNVGVLLVAAGGNSSAGRQPLAYPAAYDSVIAVTAVNRRDFRAYFAPIDSRMELAAPGMNIYSTVRGGYATLSGTSQAAPHVAGAAALFFRSNAQDINGDHFIGAADVRLLLRATAIDLGYPGRDHVFGFGLVNAGLAIPSSRK